MLASAGALDVGMTDMNGDALPDAIGIDGGGNTPVFFANGTTSCCEPFGSLPYTVIATAGSGGKVFPSGSLPTGRGGTRTFAITPNSGYGIADVLLDGVSQGPISSLTLSAIMANHTVSATFVVSTDVSSAPSELELGPARPTPSAGRMAITFSLPRAGTASVGVYDAAGRAVRTLASGWHAAGRHEGAWRGETYGGGTAGSGLYFVRLRFEGRELVRRVIWTR